MTQNETVTTNDGATYPVLWHSTYDGIEVFVGRETNRKINNYVILYHIPKDHLQYGETDGTKRPVVKGFYGESIDILLQGLVRTLTDLPINVPLSTYTSLQEYLNWIKTAQTRMLEFLKTEVPQ